MGIQIQHGQVIEALRRVWMFWPQNLLPDPQRFLKERFGIGVIVRIPVQHGQVIQALGGAWIFWPQNLAAGSGALLLRAARLWRTRAYPGTARPGH